MVGPQLSTCGCGWLVLTIFVHCMACASYTWAQTAEVEDADQQNVVPSYCGIQCLYGAIRATGQSIDFTELLRPEYLTSPTGSSIQDLELAAREHRLQTKAASNLSTWDLENAGTPIILHFSLEDHIGEYNHWVLFLGMDGGAAIIVDPPHAVCKMSFAELLSRWDSVGLLISEKPIELPWLDAKAVTAIVLAVGIGTFGAWRWSRPCFGVPASGTMQGILILTAAVIGAFAFHAGCSIGMLANSSVAKRVQQSHLPSELPEVSYERLLEHLSTNDWTIVDARFPRVCRWSYSGGH